MLLLLNSILSINFKTDRFCYLQFEVAPCSKWNLGETFCLTGKSSKVNRQVKQTPNAAGCQSAKHLKLTYWGCFICVRQFCIIFISFWYSYTSKYRGYINSYKLQREKIYFSVTQKHAWRITGSGCKNLLLSEPHRTKESISVSRHFRGNVTKWCHFLQIEFS